MHNFNQNITTNEISLFTKAFDESIILTGIPVKYIAAENVQEDKIFGEFDHQQYLAANATDVYIKFENVQSIDDSMMYSQFGLEMNDNITLFISKITCDTNKIIPQINDIIYIDFMDKILEVTNVKWELEGTGFYGGKQNHIGYKLTTHYYKNDNDVISTNIPGLDEINNTSKKVQEENSDITNDITTNDILDKAETSPWNF